MSSDGGEEKGGLAAALEIISGQLCDEAATAIVRLPKTDGQISSSQPPHDTHMAMHTMSDTDVDTHPIPLHQHFSKVLLSEVLTLRYQGSVY